MPAGSRTGGRCARSSRASSARALREAWQARLEAAEVPCGPVNDLAAVFADPQVLAREMVETVVHPTAGPIRLTGVPFKLSATPASVRIAPPLAGQHAAELLAWLGLRARRDRGPAARRRGLRAARRKLWPWPSRPARNPPESDSMGQVEVPADRYWGAQTQRSLQHFAIGDERMPLEVVHALGLLKKAGRAGQRGVPGD